MVLLLFGLWVLLSGGLSLETCVVGAGVTAALYALACRALGYSPAKDLRALKKVGGAVLFLLYLVWEMLAAGFVVMRLIYSRGREMEPRVIWFKTDLTGDSARAALANAITLTAGTLTVSQEGGQLCVHALDASLAEGLDHGAFEKKLLKLERDV